MYKNEGSAEWERFVWTLARFCFLPLSGISGQNSGCIVSEAWNQMNQPITNAEPALRMNESYLLRSLLSEAEEHLMRPSQ